MSNGKSGALGHDSVLAMVQLAILTAMVAVLQYIAGFLKFGPFAINLALTPIVIGAAILGDNSRKRGIGAGLWLGTVSAVIILITGQAADFWVVAPWETLAVVMLKGIFAGVAAAGLYLFFKKENRYIAVAAASVAAPIVNTGIFTLGCYLFFIPTLTQWAGEGKTATSFIFTVMIGWNFIVEMAVNIALIGAISIIIKSVQTSGRRSNAEEI